MNYAQSILEEHGFSFSKREEDEKFDWRALKELDIKQLVTSSNVETLVSLLEEVTYSNLTVDELDCHSTESLLKLFKLAQVSKHQA